MFNTIKVNNTDTDYTHSIFDISEYNSGAIYANLSAALAAVPQEKLKGGMSIKFITPDTPARYSVVKTENLETEPTGTLLSEAPYIDSGTYDENQLSTIFSTLPSSTGAGNALTYYVAVTVDETTTYTSWIITKVKNSVNKYVQFRYMSSSTANADFTNITNWQGVKDILTGSHDLTESCAIVKELYDFTNISPTDVIYLFFNNETPTIVASVSAAHVVYMPCNIGNMFRILATWTEHSYNVKLSVGFTTEEPAVDVTVNSIRSFVGNDVDEIFTSEVNGYIVIGYATYTYNNVVLKKAVNRLDTLLDKLEINDTTIDANKATKLSISLNQDGSVTPIDTLTLQQASDDKAGLLPAKSEWDEKPTIKSNKIVKGYNISSFMFIDKVPQIKELYINETGIQNDVARLNNILVDNENNRVQLRFANAAGNAYTARTGWVLKSDDLKIIRIYKEGDLNVTVGYIIFDFTNINSEVAVASDIMNPIAYNIAFSPYIYANKIQAFASGERLDEVNIDNALSDISNNLVKNRVIKGEFDAVRREIDSLVYEYIYTVLSYFRKARLWFKDTANTIASSVSTASVIYYPCNIGDVFRITVGYEYVTMDLKLTVGFTTEEPAEDVTVTVVDVFQQVNVNKEYTAPVNGYIVFSYSTYCWNNPKLESVTKVEKSKDVVKRLAYDNMSIMVVLGSSLTQSCVHPKYTGWVSKLNEQTDLVLINGGHGGLSPQSCVNEFINGGSLYLNSNVNFTNLSPAYVFMCNQANSGVNKAAIYDQLERLNDAVKSLGAQLILGAEEYWPGPNGTNSHDGIKPLYISAAKAFNLLISNIGKTIVDKCFNKASQPSEIVTQWHSNYRGTFSHIAHLDLINTLPIKQSIKMFRVRPDKESAQISELVYTTLFDRISKFVAISAGENNCHYAHNGVNYNIGYEDADTVGSPTDSDYTNLQYALPGSADISQSGSLSETADMVAGRNVTFNKYALMECLFDGIPAKIEFNVSKTGDVSNVYYLNNSGSWTSIDAQINASNILFSMDVPYGALSNGRLRLLFASSGEFSLSKPEFLYSSQTSRSFNSTPYSKRLFGTELLSNTNPTITFTNNQGASNISFPTGLEMYSEYNTTKAVTKLINEGSIEHIVQIPSTAKKIVFRVIAQAFTKFATTKFNANDSQYANFVTNDVPELTIGENDYAKMLITLNRYKSQQGSSLSGASGLFVKESLVSTGWSEIYFEYDNEYDDNELYPYLKITIKRELYGKLPVLIHDVSIQTI